MEHHRYRANDHHTSVAGASDVAFRAGSQKAKLLLAYFDHGALTADEAMEHAGVSPRSCYWKRCSELRELGYIEMTGEERPGSSGSLQIVCHITADGIKAVRGLL